MNSNPSDSLIDQLEHSPLAIVEWDRNYRILRWAGQAEQIFGWSKSEAVGRSFADLHLIPEEGREVFHFAMSELLRPGARSNVVRNKNRKKTGENIQLEWFGTPMLNDAGEIVSFLSVGRDLSEEVSRAIELERHRDRLAFALNAANMGVWDLELDTLQTQFSPELARLFEMESRDVTTGTLMERVMPEERDRLISTAREAVKARRMFQVEFRIRLRSGLEKWILASGRADYDSWGAPIRVLGTAQDVTERRNLENELRDAKRNADAASDLKSRFLANMSHEIRSPLGSILGFAELLADPLLGPEDRAEYFQIIQRNGNFLSRLIEDILDLSKVEAGRMEIKCDEVNPYKLLEETLAPHRIVAREKGLRLSLCYEGAVPSRMKTDPVRFKQVVSNILGNALKFTMSGEVRVKVAMETTEGGRARMKMSITDTGPGLTHESQNRLFEPFFQVSDAGTRGIGGTGLGLALSRRIARLLGGDIALVKSEAGKGSEFLITFDAGVPNSIFQSGSAVRSAAQGQDCSMLETGQREEMLMLKGLRVLLVEDSPDNQVLMQKLLTKRGAIVDLASDGVAGVSQALSGTHDVVLMDIQMPKLDGYHATQQLREANFQKPIIALTAHAMKDERQRCLDAGCDDHLSKPVNAADLVRVIRHYVVDQMSL